jgi:hypothetical protein
MGARAMSMTTPARLIKVRAANGAGHRRRGAGWAVGTSGVLTARHVLQPLLEGPSGHCIAVPDPSPESEVFDCALLWEDVGADLALLSVSEEQIESWSRAIGADHLSVLGDVPPDGIDATAIGYPDASLSRGFPVPEHVVGTLLPAAASVTGRMTLDVDTSVPAREGAWEGMSGAAVRDRHEGSRLLGIVTDVALARQQRRLLVTPIPAPQSDPEFALALRIVGAPTHLESSSAPLMRRLFRDLDASGRPMRLNDIRDIGVLGPRRARTDVDLRGNAYHPYVRRAVHQRLTQKVGQRAAGRDSRALFVAGPPMSGKSRMFRRGRLGGHASSGGSR